MDNDVSDGASVRLNDKNNGLIISEANILLFRLSFNSFSLVEKSFYSELCI